MVLMFFCCASNFELSLRKQLCFEEIDTICLIYAETLWVIDQWGQLAS
jgi:hypothetical protein